MSRRLLAIVAAFGSAIFTSQPSAADVFGGADRSVPLPRFVEPVCPGVVGLKLEVAEAVVGRIRENADKLGLPLADPSSCEPNVIASFVVDGRDFTLG